MIKVMAAMTLLTMLVACSSDQQGQTSNTTENTTVEATEKLTTAEGADKNSENTDADIAEEKAASAQSVETGGDVFKGYKTEQVAEHTYVVHGPLTFPNKINQGFMNNPGFVVTDTSVIVVDPGSSVQTGRALAKRIQEVTKNPVTHIFASHIHGDHWLGNHGIRENWPDAKIYAHPKMIELAKAGAAEQWVGMMKNMTGGATEGTEAVLPTEGLADLQDIKVDNITIRAHLTDKAHTTTDAMFEVVEDKLLFTGDNATTERIPRMDDGQFRGNIAAMERALTLAPSVVVPGHGPTGSSAILEDYRDYLATIYSTAEELLEEGLQPFEMKPQIIEKLGKYEDWNGFEDEIGKHTSLATLEAEQAAFE